MGNFSAARVMRGLILLGLCTILPILLLKAMAASYNVPDAFASVQTITSQTGSDTHLPFQEIVPNDRDVPLIAGTFVLDIPKTQKQNVLMIEGFDGALKITAQNHVIFDSNVARKKLNGLQNLRYFVTLPSDLAGERVIFNVTLSKNISGFVSLSNIYLAQEADFQAIVERQVFFEDKLRNFLLGGAALAIISLVSALPHAAYRIDYAAPLVAIMFIFGAGMPAAMPVLIKSPTLFAYIVFTAPLAGSSFIGFALLSRRNPSLVRARTTKIMSLGLFITIANFFAHLNLGIPPLTVNLFVSVPILLVCLVLSTFLSAATYIRSNFYPAAALCVCSATFLFSIAHDFALRFDAIDGEVYISNVSILLLFLTMFAAFVARVLYVGGILKAANRTKTAALRVQAKTLNAQYEKNLSLEATERKNAALRSLTLDLHDGVMSYLALISAVTEKTNLPEANEINRLSSTAANEIRFIIDSASLGQVSPLQAVSSVRTQIGPTLHQMGIAAEWDIISLIDLDLRTPSHAMDIMRIVQEAVNNAVNRAKCKRLFVCADKTSDGEVEISVENTGGETFNPAGARGQGLASMTSRASKLGGTFDIQPIPSGARVIVRLPASLFTPSETPIGPNSSIARPINA
ncbi:sensor histidine kinase [Celeribacter marinus]|uniref:sensor histidine kinase n=1 Tax=Celeribacter marinus TaxID=1397108 RepID=UPI00316F8E51